MIYKVVNDLAPLYLKNLLPFKTIDRHNYNLRNINDFRIPYCRIDCYKKSFFPRGLSLWNNLEDSIKFSTSLSTFISNYKRCKFLNTEHNKLNQKLFNYGVRYWSCIHARIRMGCSKLNEHLFRNLHVIDSETCSCGFKKESSFHYFFRCSKYDEQRAVLFQTINSVSPPNICITLQLLLFGDPKLSFTQNCKVFDAVHKYLITTKRFD